MKNTLSGDKWKGREGGGDVLVILIQESTGGALERQMPSGEIEKVKTKVSTPQGPQKTQL